MDTSDDTSDVRQPVSNSSRRRRGRRARGSESDASKKPTLSSQDNPEELDHPDYDIEDDEENEDDMEADYGNDGFGDGASAARRSEMAALFSFGGIRMSSQGGGASSSRFSDMLRQLKDQNDQTMQMVALQELSELLSMATEDMFIGHGSQSMAGFNTHDFVKALVDIIRGPSPDSLGDDIPAEMLAELGMAAHELGLGGAGPNPELMLLACRCLSNLIEAHPSSTMHVLQHGAVSVLVGKLMEVEYIDLAEQVLSVLGKISQEYPSAIIRANGLLAVLQYIDFFSLHVQRTAVSIAANACRGLNNGRADKHAQTFGMIKEVLPIFERLLSYADQKLVEQVVRALGRIVDWCSASMERSEKLITTSFLRTISTLVNPVTAPSTVTSNPAIFTQLIKLLASAARSSPKLAMEMLQDHDIVNLVRGYLTGGRITDSNDLDEIETEVLSAAVTQVVVTRPVDQVTEVLNLALSLLPTLPREDVWDLNNDQSGVPRVELSQQKGQTDAKGRPPPSPAKSTPSPQSSSDVVNADATGTTGTSSRSATAGKGKPALSPHDASHFKLLQEHPELVNSYTQQILPILIEVFGATVNANVRRKVVEGVGKGVWYSSDSSVLADVRTVPDKERREALALVAGGLQIALVVIRKCGPSYRTWFAREGALEEMSKMISMDESDRVEVELAATAAEAASTLSDQQGTPTSSTAATTSGLPVPMSRRLSDLVRDLKRLRDQVAGHIGTSSAAPGSSAAGTTAGQSAATDVGVGVTGYEILESGLMQALSDFLTKPGATDITVPLSDTERPEYALSLALRLKSFLHVFLNGPTPDPANRSFFVPGGFKRTVQLLQESLSRVESFDVVSATQAGGSFGTENSSNSPSMQLTRQLRIKLVAEEPETVPKQYESVLISVHAIAPFKALEDYLKGRVGNAPDFEKKDAAAEGGSAAKASGTEDAVASSSGLEPDEEAEPKDSDEEDAEEKDHRENVEASVRAALGDGAEDDDENEEGDDDDDQHDMDEDEDIEEDYEDDDDLGDDETVNVSDLLLHSEEARRQSRRGSQFNETEGGAASADATGGSGEGSRRDSVVDVRADIGSPAPSSQSKDATDARVGTPKQPSAATPSSASTPGVPTTEGTSTSSSKSSKPAAAATTGSMRSYASAVTTSTNFSLQFSIGDVEIPRDMTIFGAAFQHEQRRVSSGQQPNVWQAMYTIKYKKVATPSSPAIPPVVPTAERPTRIKLPFKTEPPEGISLETPAGQILYVLRLLYGLNTRCIEALPATAFVNTKLTAKLNRQLDEPLIVASHVLPKWCASLAKEFSFLVPFETRLIYLQSTSFGYSRSMGRWQHQQQQSQNASDTHNRNNRSDGTAQLGRIQRQKVRIARHRILDSMVKVMELYGSTQALLEVEFFDEVGTGLGPTLEFYSNVCRELRKRQGVSLGPAPEKLRVWRDDDVITVELPAEYLNPSLGFFPSPLSPHQLSTPSGRQTLTLFKALGTFVGKALLDSRIVDLPFNPIFLEMVVGEEEEEELLAERAFGHIDPALYKSLLDLKKYVSQKDVIEGDTTLTPEEKAARLRNVTVKDARIEDLCLDFTLPGYPDLDLCPNGKNTPLTLANLESYIEHVVEMSVGTGILTQIESFRSGFDRVFPVADLRSFTVQELGVLVSGSETENWEYDVLRQSIKADHGYTSDSRVILQLATYMSQLSPLHRREFLQFVTGSPKLPIGGFGALSPPLTVVRKTVDAGRKPDDFLPSVMTCVNYLKVPEYSDFEVLQARFEVAVREGQGCFHLS
ncbi:hypothetical protein DFS34DRAFT_579446 [Phlyctochytrium arcticum]|nr:hypothetical protein DFS34DRAFT_579446 [Phlyctochytrium arcticum]